MKTNDTNLIRPLVMTALMVGLLGDGVFASEGQVSSSGGNTVYTTTSQERNLSAIDIRNARPMPLPISDVAPFAAEAASQSSGVAGFAAGSRGTGQVIGRASTAEEAEAEASLRMAAEAADDDVTPQEFGTANHPFTTSRVDLLANTPSRLYPYRAAGKLYFKIGTSTFVCSASLIKKGVIVTAAHCVANFGKSQFYTGWQFIPALSGVLKPYGIWTVTTAFVRTTYFNGTDTCAVAGIVCENDVAVLVVRPKLRIYPGRLTGWFGYGWDGYGFAPTNPETALINQLGYPVSHDAGLKMQRTDSQGFESGMVSNTVWGSRQTGGSSGGPELVNLGLPATLTGGVLLGSEAAFDIVVGVTSWGYTDQAVKQQGASRFTATNIVSLVTAACGATPAACAP